MDPNLLQYYRQELQFMREMGGEFAQEFPKIAGRLGLEGGECADPYVERLLEGFAFLAARVQLKLDAEFPRFTQHLLETVYPHYLSPTPSMAVVQLQPDLTDPGLAEAALRSLLGKHDQTSCEYRTAHEVTFWPLELTKASYLPTLAGAKLPSIPGAKAAIRLKLHSTAGLAFNELTLDTLPIYLKGGDELPTHIYEQIFSHAIAVVIQSTNRRSTWHEILDKGCIKPIGFDDAQALLPCSARSFQGYRLLHEYFALPERFMFTELTGLSKAVQRCTNDELELFIILDQNAPFLNKQLDATNFSLFCTPVVNLFPKECDRIHLSDRFSEHHVVPDRTRPMDFEIYSVSTVRGYGSGTDRDQEFLPFYASNDLAAQYPEQSFFTQRRERRVLSSKQRRNAPRSSYIGSEIFLSLVDANEAPYSANLRQLGISTLCTNRDLPLSIPIGKGTTDFTLEAGAPVDAIKCITGPTKPSPSWAEGDTTWRLISHLSLNYLSIVNNDEEQGAKALRELLGLYANIAEASVRKQIGGVRSISTKPVIRRIPTPGPIALGRGLAIELTFDEEAFEGSGIFILGAVLERFFARYISINSFTETTIKSTERGEIMRWPLRIGQRHVL